MTRVRQLVVALLLCGTLGAWAPGGDVPSVRLMPDKRPLQLLQLDPQSVENAAAVLTRLHQRYNAPTVMVRPERPKWPDEAEVARMLVAELRQYGFEAMAEASAMDQARQAADEARKAQVPDDAAKAALNLRPDFEITVHSEQSVSQQQIYANKEEIVRKSLRCSIQWRGRELKPCERSLESRRLMLNDADRSPDQGFAPLASEIGPEVAAALALEWIRADAPTQPRLVEVRGGLPSDQVKLMGGKVITDSPGVSTTILLDGELPASLRAEGPPLLERPGYVLIGRSAGSGWLPVAAPVAALVIAAICLPWILFTAIKRARSRGHRFESSSPPRPPAGSR